ncbi:MAG: bifunctional ornithine acetyltransferase/N-acetylglutamate synthase, partial [Candidatus Hydrogenedentes bacterium]|nr:bifunctional ornithine acetyltransferase/N-acetylglutamate synthase [Candidatus Hydrogenedentota bacterium]
MKPVDGGICAPKGFRASGIPGGIKKPGAPKKDCALVVSDGPATVAGVFTTNIVKAAPVSWSEGVCIRGEARAVFINSGNANAATGRQGAEDVQATAEQLALALDIPITQACICSTGVIGVPLPMDRLLKGLETAVAALSPTGGADAAEAIMTTDTVPKSLAVEVDLSSGPVRIGAMAKGAGMIAPNMATMIAVITTDAAIAAEDLKSLLKYTADRSFNCMCVDNDMSTNDTVLCLANGASGVPALQPESEDYELFAEAFMSICADL